MKIETAGAIGRKTGSKFCAVVKGNTEKTYIYGISGDATLNQVELMAVKFAATGLTVDNAVISTPNQYVADILKLSDTNEWLKSPKSNAQLVEEIRELILQKKITVIYERSEQVRDMCKK